jgi:uncharacterized protein YggE
MTAWRGFVAATLAPLVFVPSGARAQVRDAPHSLSVTGHGVVWAEPDTARVTVGVMAREVDLKEAKASVDTAVGRLATVADTLPADTRDLKISSINVYPRYATGGSDAFLGYEVTRSVAVTLRDVARLEGFLDDAIEAGANRDFSVSLTSSREAGLKLEAQALAIASARTQAEHAAAELGLRLGAVPGVHVAESLGTFMNKPLGAASPGWDYEASGGRFLPGRIEFRAEASATFRNETGDTR